jgi:glutamate N-acetyltransferase/amino-acid N-acetyltransferase
MIHPNMATMLAVITTDAKIAPALLDRALRVAVNASFNRISVDGDMSTNDTLLVLANGSSGKEIGELEIRDFTNALTQVATNLAQQLVRDGEGATKFVEIVVSGARDENDAARVAKAIANSPLTKTALYGGDANWGRVICAAGYSGVAVEPAKMKLWFGDVNVFANGTPTNFDEADSTRAIAGADVFIRLDLGQGDAHTTVWTCDLSHDYVTINGKYRT